MNQPLNSVPGWWWMCLLVGMVNWVSHKPFVYAESPDIRLPIVQLFDTNIPGNAPSQTDPFALRASWTQIPEDASGHEWQGDVVICNGPIALLLPKNRLGGELYSLQAEHPQLQAVIFPGQPSATTSGMVDRITIVENSPGAVTLSIQFAVSGESIALEFTLTVGDVTVQMNPGGNCPSIFIQSHWEYAIVPDFFADDIVLQPSNLSDSAILLPVANVFLLAGAQGNQLMMGVVKSNQTAIRVHGNLNQGNGISIQCMPSEPVFLATLSQPQIWSDLSSGWSPPFTAKWRTSILQTNGMCRSTTSPQFDRSSLSSNTPAIVYPIDRETATPLLAILPTDILRTTLGVGPCKNILEAERFDADDRSTPAETAAWIVKQFDTHQDERYEKEIGQRLDAMLLLCQQSYARIEEYLKFSHTLAAFVEKLDLPNLSNRTNIAEIGTIAGELSQAIRTMQSRMQSLDAVAALTVSLNHLIGTERAAEKAASLCSRLAAIGAAQNYTLSKCRTLTRWIHVQCLMALESDGSPVEFYRETAQQAERLLQHH